MIRRYNGSYIWLLAGLLFLCLACLEIPELSRLTDDVSNDFTILIAVNAAASEPAPSPDAQKAGPAVFAGTQPPAFLSVRSAFDPHRLGERDLLAIYSLRRT